MNEQSLKYFNRVRELIAESRPFVSVTLVQSKGQAPQDPSAKMLVTLDGWLEGTVGGGKIEAKAISFAQQLLQSRSAPVLMTWNLQTDIGMSCGGEVSLFFEAHCTQRWPVTVFGAGHVAQALVRLLIHLDCALICIDPRAEWLHQLPESPRLKKILHPQPAEWAMTIPQNTFVVVMTQGHATDFPILKTILTQWEPPYTGVIGSSVKAMKLRKELAEAGVHPNRIERLFCPVGLPLGNNSPEEIAISIAAQLIRVRDNSSIVNKN